MSSHPVLTKTPSFLATPSSAAAATMASLLTTTAAQAASSSTSLLSPVMAAASSVFWSCSDAIAGAPTGNSGTFSVGNYEEKSHVAFVSEGRVVITRAKTMEIVQVFEDHQKEAIIAVQWCTTRADGKLATASNSRINIYYPSTKDTKNAKLSVSYGWNLVCCLNKVANISTFTWSPAGDMILIGANDLSLWKLSDESEIQRWSRSPGSIDEISSLSFSIDGFLLAIMTRESKSLQLLCQSDCKQDWNSIIRDYLRKDKPVVLFQSDLSNAFVLECSSAIVTSQWNPRIMFHRGMAINMLSTLSCDGWLKIWCCERMEQRGVWVCRASITAQLRVDNATSPVSWLIEETLCDRCLQEVSPSDVDDWRDAGASLTVTSVPMPDPVAQDWLLQCSSEGIVTLFLCEGLKINPAKPKQIYTFAKFSVPLPQIMSEHSPARRIFAMSSLCRLQSQGTSIPGVTQGKILTPFMISLICLAQGWTHTSETLSRWQLRVQPGCSIEERLQYVGNSNEVADLIAHPLLPLLASIGRTGELLLWESNDFAGKMVPMDIVSGSVKVARWAATCPVLFTVDMDDSDRSGISAFLVDRRINVENSVKAFRVAEVLHCGFLEVAEHERVTHLAILPSYDDAKLQDCTVVAAVENADPAGLPHYLRLWKVGCQEMLDNFSVSGRVSSFKTTALRHQGIISAVSAISVAHPLLVPYTNIESTTAILFTGHESGHIKSWGLTDSGLVVLSKFQAFGENIGVDSIQPLSSQRIIAIPHRRLDQTLIAPCAFESESTGIWQLESHLPPIDRNRQGITLFPTGSGSILIATATANGLHVLCEECTEPPRIDIVNTTNFPATPSSSTTTPRDATSSDDSRYIDRERAMRSTQSQKSGGLSSATRGCGVGWQKVAQLTSMQGVVWKVGHCNAMAFMSRGKLIIAKGRQLYEFHPTALLHYNDLIPQPQRRLPPSVDSTLLSYSSQLHPIGGWAEFHPSLLYHLLTTGHISSIFSIFRSLLRALQGSDNSLVNFEHFRDFRRYDFGMSLSQPAEPEDAEGVEWSTDKSRDLLKYLKPRVTVPGLTMHELIQLRFWVEAIGNVMDANIWKAYDDAGRVFYVLSAVQRLSKAKINQFKGMLERRREADSDSLSYSSSSNNSSSNNSNDKNDEPIPPNYGMIARPLHGTDFVWAAISSCGDTLMEHCCDPSDPNWTEFAPALWFDNTERLRSWTEKLARAQFLRNKDPSDCALSYLAIGKKSVLLQFYKAAKNDKIVAFFSREPQMGEAKWKAAASKNAFVLLGQHNYVLSAAFFLLGGDVLDACRVLMDHMKSPQQALLIARLAEGGDGEIYRRFIIEQLVPSALKDGDLGLVSVLMWRLKRYSDAYRILWDAKCEQSLRLEAKVTDAGNNPVINSHVVNDDSSDLPKLENSNFNVETHVCARYLCGLMEKTKQMTIHTMSNPIPPFPVKVFKRHASYTCASNGHFHLALQLIKSTEEEENGKCTDSESVDKFDEFSLGENIGNDNDDDDDDKRQGSISQDVVRRCVLHILSEYSLQAEIDLVRVSSVTLFTMHLSNVFSVDQGWIFASLNRFCSLWQCFRVLQTLIAPVDTVSRPLRSAPSASSGPESPPPSFMRKSSLALFDAADLSSIRREVAFSLAEWIALVPERMGLTSGLSKQRSIMVKARTKIIESIVREAAEDKKSGVTVGFNEEQIVVLAACVLIVRFMHVWDTLDFPSIENILENVPSNPTKMTAWILGCVRSGKGTASPREVLEQAVGDISAPSSTATSLQIQLYRTRERMILLLRMQILRYMHSQMKRLLAPIAAPQGFYHDTVTVKKRDSGSLRRLEQSSSDHRRVASLLLTSLSVWTSLTEKRAKISLHQFLCHDNTPRVYTPSAAVKNIMGGQSEYAKCRERMWNYHGGQEGLTCFVTEALTVHNSASHTQLVTLGKAFEYYKEKNSSLRLFGQDLMYRGLLQVRVLEAAGLCWDEQAHKHRKEVSPFALVRWMGCGCGWNEAEISTKTAVCQHSFRTGVVKNSRSPTWNALFEFPIFVPRSQLRVDVIHHRALTADAVLGYALVDTTRMVENVRHDFWAPIHLNEGNKTSVTGKLHLEMTFSYSMQELRDDPAPSPVKEKGAKSP